MRKVWSLLNLILPEQCPICNRPSDNLKTSPMCSCCWDLIRAGGSKRRCLRCGIALDTTYDTSCLECIKDPPFYEKVYVFGDYDGHLREAIHYMKFHGRKNLSKVLGNLLGMLDIPAVDAIIPVPLGRRRLVQRGFNQSYLLARRLSVISSVPVLDDLLLKKTETPPQSLLSRQERLRNQRGSFSLNPNYQKIPRRVALVDDVVTTTATVNECARVLKKAGVKEVYVIALARAISV